MKIGFTGTRHGMSAVQRLTLVAQLRAMHVTEFHHGDCVGSDAEAAEIVADLFGSQVCRIHPPIENAYRAFSKFGAVVDVPKTHFARNRDIVESCDLLIATPVDHRITKKTLGGTAYTVNYAEKRKKPVLILWPSGRISRRPEVEQELLMGA